MLVRGFPLSSDRPSSEAEAPEHPASATVRATAPAVAATPAGRTRRVRGWVRTRTRLRLNSDLREVVSLPLKRATSEGTVAHMPGISTAVGCDVSDSAPVLHPGGSADGGTPWWRTPAVPSLRCPANGEDVTPFVLPHTLLGDGPHRVVAVHGWLADRDGFAAVRPDLDLESFTYAFVDLRGYGEAMGTPGAYTTSEGAADVLCLAGRLGWERFSLVGHSMGAAVAQRVLALAPGRVRRLVGVSPVPAHGMPMPPEQWGLFADAADRPANRRLIIDLTTGSVRPGAWLDRMVRRSVERSDAKA